MPTLAYVQMDQNDLSGKDWLWIDTPGGDRFMLMARGVEVQLDDEVVCGLARGVLRGRAAAS